MPMPCDRDVYDIVTRTLNASPKASDWVCRTLSDIFFPCS